MLSSIALTFAEANRYFNTELSAHFRAIDRQEAVHKQAARRAETGVFEFGRPEEGVEVENVLADEVVQLGL